MDIITSEEEFYYVYKYQFIDNLESIVSPYTFFEDDKIVKSKLEIVKKFFKYHGWEGDGEIGLIWIPPFVDGIYDSTIEHYVWHVKQDNNGQSFIASEDPLEFKAFNEETAREETTLSSPIRNRCIECTITENVRDGLIYDLDNLEKRLIEINKVQEITELSSELYQSILMNIQNEVVADLNVFLEECYLKFLIHVLNDGNQDGLKLKSIKANVKLDSIGKLPGKEYKVDWLIIQEVISNCYNDFKFLPFKEKYERVAKCVDYKCDNDIKKEIFKHVTIRNCYQHHEGKLVVSALKMLGMNEINIKSETGEISIQKNERIILTSQEIKYLIDTMRSFSYEFDSYIKERMQSREYKLDRNNLISKLSDYIYHLLYEEEYEEVEVYTEKANFVIYESSTLKVNYEECTMKEFYEVLDELGEKAECNNIVFKKEGNEYTTLTPIYRKLENHSSIIQL